MSTQLTQQILGLTIGLFNMSAGANHLSNFSGYIQQIQTNWSLTDDEAMAELARALVLSPVFQAQLVGKDTAEARALMVLTHFGLQNEVALLVSTTAAIQGFATETYQAELAMLIWGYTKALLLDAQVKERYHAASNLFNNKLSIANQFSVIEANTSTDIAILQASLAPASSVDIAALAQAQSQEYHAIESGALLDMSALPVQALYGATSWSRSGFSYSYNNSLPNDYTGVQSAVTLYGNLTTGWQALSAPIRTSADTIMNDMSVLIETPVSFVESTGDVRFNLIPTASNVAAFAYSPGRGSISGDIFIDTDITQTNSYLSKGGYGYFTIAHEIGHALGLKHPFEEGVMLPNTQDHRVNTIMSYTDFRPFVPYFTHSYTQVSVVYQQVYPESFMVYDIAALQNLYGADTQHHYGNNVYVFDSTPFYRTIWDAGGIDTLDFSATTHTNVVRLISGSYSDVNYRSVDMQIAEQQQLYRSKGVTYADSFVASSLEEIESMLYTGEQALGIAYGVVVENVIGGSGNDVFYDNAVNNKLWGGSGNDTFYIGAGGYDYIDGGEGEDTVALPLNFSQVQIHYGSDIVTLIGADFAVDLLAVEYLVFADQTRFIA